MNAQTQIPADVLAMMEEKKTQVRKSIADENAAKARELQELLAKGLAIFQEFIEKSLADVPEWLRDYFDRIPYQIDDDDFVGLGRGWNNLPRRLYFSIPGLAMIVQDTNNKQYKSFYAWWNDTANDAPELQFRQDCMTWRDDLEYVLCEAEKQLKEHEQNLQNHATLVEEAEKHRLKEEERETAREVKAWNESRREEAREKSEAQLLFEIVQNDPIMLTLLKAIVLVQEERGDFRQRIQDADESLYSMENRWSRRAEELRRQADDAERRAADERSRLQDDLDDAEAKLKKAERVARGW